MNKIGATIVVGLLLMLSFQQAVSQTFLHTRGDSIVDGEGNNFLIRSLGTGNWMIMEGYMMQSYVGGGTHTGFRNRLEQDIGVAKTDSFYTAWLQKHMTRTDIDSMASWGFNTVRPALHYRWFTLPIEEEPVAGENTWLETGFELIDSLIDWCSDNNMYIILDMHGAPGGQGEDRAISDYDPTKPSLWESEENKTKLVKLWGKIADRYKNEPFIGGYDLINEPNWDLPGGTALRDLYERITEEIRQYDENHIIIIEGNWFANDFTGLTPPWDDNMVYSFHKYWSSNAPGSLGYGTWLRDAYNVPVWLGETGENSNVWFASLVDLCEKENVGWSFWPVKKGATSNILRVEFNEDYYDLLSSWDGNGSMNEDESFQAVLTLAEQHQFENCVIQWDVIDALIRQPFSNELKPYSIFDPEEKIWVSDYALGRHGIAYFDSDTGNYSGSPGGGSWNNGGAYRNDGVDIQVCEDQEETNGYNVGWTEKGEWMVYHLQTDSAMLADIQIRSASGSSTGSAVVLEANGKVISEEFQLPSTGGWQDWVTSTFSDIKLPGGDVAIKLRILSSGSNINYFTFSNIKSPDEENFRSLFAETPIEKNSVTLHLNDSITDGEFDPGDFTLHRGTLSIDVAEVKYTKGELTVEIIPAEILSYGNRYTISYSGSNVFNGEDILDQFTEMNVFNQLNRFKTLPARIQAEDYIANNGFALEECLDAGGGLNTGYSNTGDYLDYLVNVEEEKVYGLNLRVALNNGNARIKFLAQQPDGTYEEIENRTLSPTGGWQSWETQAVNLTLPKGKYRFRVLTTYGEFNMNWIEFGGPVGIDQDPVFKGLTIYPNPVSELLHIDLPHDIAFGSTLRIFDPTGRTVFLERIQSANPQVKVSDLRPGIYYLQIRGVDRNYPGVFVVNR